MKAHPAWVDKVQDKPDQWYSLDEVFVKNKELFYKYIVRLLILYFIKRFA